MQREKIMFPIADYAIIIRRFAKPIPE